MTKEEIVNNGNKAFIREVSDGGKANVFVVGYMACANEYEKRLAELEKELKELTITNEYQKVISDKNERISFLEIRNEELLNSVAELKKRNGELAGQKASLGRWLGEANAVIKKFSEFLNSDVEYDPEHPQEHTDLWNELCERAERFLKEFTPNKV